MGIASGIVQTFLKLTNGVFAKNMLNFLGVFVDVIRCDVGRIGEIQLPETVITYDLTGALPTGRGEGHGIAEEGHESGASNRGELPLDIFEGLAAAFRQLAKTHMLAAEFITLKHMVNGLERIFALDPGGS